MLVRIISAVALFPILFIIVFMGGIPLKLGIIFASLMGLYEFYKAMFKKIKLVNYLGFVFSVIYILLLGTKYFSFMYGIIILFTLIGLSFTVVAHKSVYIYDIAITFFGVMYITLMFSTVYLINELSYGEYIVWIPFIAAWACDSGAYFVGITLGKHKLTPELSPKKTIEGAIGGVVTSAIICAIYGVFISLNVMDITHIFSHKLGTIIIFAIVGVIGAIFAQLGDLTASAIKRKFEIKDYGKLIPGHGGILDRFDSILFTSGACFTMFMIIDAIYIIQ